MIYVNNDTIKIILPKTNTSYQQNRIVVNNQLTNFSYEFHLTDISDSIEYYEFIRPNFDCNGYLGSYDYKIYHNDILLDNGIVVVEGANVVEDIEYTLNEKIYEYTPNTVFYPEVSRVKTITENGEYDVENFDKVIIEVYEGADCNEVINSLREQINALEDVKTRLEAENEILDRENEVLEEENKNLQGKIDTVTTFTITSNGVYTPNNNTLGWNKVIVNVPNSGEGNNEEYEELITALTNTINTLQNEINTLRNEKTELENRIDTITSINITQEGIYEAPEGVLGYNKITVSIENPDEPVEPNTPNYLYFKNYDGNNWFSIKYKTDGTTSPNFEYSYDGVNFTQWDYSDLFIRGTQTLYLRGVNNTRISDINNHFTGHATGCDKVIIGGNIMSLVDGIGETKVIPDDYMFSNLFQDFFYSVVDDSSSKVDLYLSDLVLPATELTTGCYQDMFSGTDVWEMPKELPAKVLKPYCYANMFASDTLTTITNRSYVTPAPILYGETLVEGCYDFMFWNCSQISYIVCLAKYNPDAIDFTYMCKAETNDYIGQKLFICYETYFWEDMEVRHEAYMSYLPAELLDRLYK
jgi:cell division protein FtsB